MARRIIKKKKVTDEADEFMSLTQQIWLGISEKPKEAAMIAGGTIGVILIVLMGFFLRDRARTESVSLLAEAVARYHQEEGVGRDVTGLTEELGELAENQSGKTLGGQALYYLGGIRAESGDHQGAIETYEKVRKEYGENEHLANAAGLALAYTYRLAGEDQKSLQLFGELAEQKESTLPLAQIQLEIGLINDGMGRRDEAAGAYRTVIDTYPDSTWSSQAQERLASIEGT